MYLTLTYDGADLVNWTPEELRERGVPATIIAAAILEKHLAALRAERDRRLAACDWTQIADADLTNEQRAAWSTYRQALRDLPDTVADPAAPVWPDKP
ncbi:tail fiber assembly protein [Chitinimonas koreensis]|uniref:tail fiber assembly protein n=1 Tax=Chitinimonas koreensis TaxID=356302 RepID=UPI00040647FE|nr:tail fiber assembly protein [Chitinimonas koreensis]